ncbi:hypothetical protein ACWZHB_21310 [Nocardia sp. FBN12]|uniref:hypothetical protein n=1 Tax=Nocardia sp. FBN12 TaxID=3419766 RepID=UPI003CFF376C
MTDQKHASYRAAWVPMALPEHPLDPAVELCIGWINSEAHRLGLYPVLMSPTRPAVESSEPLAEFAAANVHITALSHAILPGSGPVLSYTPDVKELVTAVTLTKDTALCVLENVIFPVHGWAAAVGALNLATGQVTDPPPEDLATQLRRLAHAGYKGFTDNPTKLSANEILTAMSERDDYDPGFIVGYLAAQKQVSAAGLVRLQGMAAEFAP